MAYFSIKPDFFMVEKKGNATKGVIFSDTIVSLIEHELNGPGGWVPNDLPPFPTWFLDNKPNFQLGILEVGRYSSRVLRDNLSRQRSTDTINAECDKAFTSFSNDPHRWIMPSAEGKYRKGIENLKQYIQHLHFGSANFYPRSDNLIQLLEQYISLLGGVNTRLLNASRKHGLPDDYAIDSEQVEDKQMPSKVPWTRIDDNFYYAQGVGYALYHMYQAIRFEFVTVLNDKNADILVNDIITSLEETYFEPIVITNGSKDGFFANHSNNLRVFLDDARQKSNSLIRMLDQG
jgi:hypothetical protein